MSVADYLSELRSLGIRVRVQGDHLQIDAPKGVLTKSIQRELGERKPDILAFLNQASGVRTAGDRGLKPTGLLDNVPLSFQQLRVWQLLRLGLSSTAYNLSKVFRLRGALRIPDLEKSVLEIVRRHDILRTTFKMHEGEPVQIISSQSDVKLSVTDLRDRISDTPAQEIQKRIDQEVQREFDLKAGPLMRVSLLWMHQAEFILIITAHHIIFDGWSLDIFLKELGLIYNAYSSGQPLPLPPLTVQYADFAIWQRRQQVTSRYAGQIQFWEEQFLENVDPLELPLDQSRKSIISDRSATRELTISEHQLDQLDRKILQVSGTKFIAVFSIFAALLHAYTGQEQLIICTPIANRNQIETENLIGYLNNIVVLRADASGDPGFLEFVERLHHYCLEVFDNQDIPFQLVADLPGVRHTPLARGLFAFEEASDQTLDFRGLEVLPLSADSEETYHDLAVFISPGKGGEWRGEIVYKIELFDDDTIAIMAENFLTMFDAILENPEFRLSHLTDKLIIPARNALEIQEAERDYVPPRSDIERELVRVWERVFRTQPIGIQDDFFDLGGHSLLAVRLFVQIEKQFGKSLSGKFILESPTIEVLAKSLQDDRSSIQNEDSWPMVQALKPAGSNPPFFYIGRGVAAIKMARLMKPKQPFYKLDLDRNRYLSVDEMATMCSEKILAIHPEGDCLLGGFCFDGFVAIETARKLQSEGRDVALLDFAQSG